MNAPILIKIIVGLAIIALIFTNKIVPYLRDKLFMSVSKSGYFTTILVITVISVFGVAFNRYQKMSRNMLLKIMRKQKGKAN